MELEDEVSALRVLENHMFVAHKAGAAQPAGAVW
jgi:hypothetical protein